MINPKRKLTRAVAFAILFCFTSLTGAQPLYAIPPNTQLPVLDNSFDPIGGVTIPELNAIKDNIMNITQTDETSIIKWKDFSIGADAIVNFTRENGGTFNSLNFVNSGAVSEIYGQLTALGGNIFIANPAGVTIGNSAQINVGSLYVTNKKLDESTLLNALESGSSTDDIRKHLSQLNTQSTAQLMSLGAITNATNVTFDGARIVLDTDRIYTANETTGELEQVNGDWFKTGLDIITTDKDNVVLGSSERANIFTSFSINGDNDTLEKGYTWVHDLNELQAMNYDTSGWYALRNSIDANATSSFTPIGNYDMETGPFTGRFDGLGYSIFGLKVNVTNESDAAGLFGVTDGAHIKNFTLNGGSISGGKYVGAAVGSASGGVIENITNTASVSGKGGENENGVGGIVGYAGNAEMSGLINIGTITGEEDSVNVGGIVGNMQSGSLTGETYNLGSVTGGWNIGGIVGQMTNGAKIGNDGDDAFQIYNQLNVTGDYNVGGIAGTLSSGTITNAANHGNVTAEGYTNDIYKYHTAAAQENLDGAELNDNLASIAVKAANAGGIAGKTEKSAEISNVVNEGDVTTETEGDDNHYIAGNIGGIVGRAEDTTITNAENKENIVAGAHNVGGVAGFLGGVSSVEVGTNNGGDITATGARKYSAEADGSNGYAKERVRPIDGNELFNIGNIGGIVGYLFGDSAKIKNSGNRGTVHSAEIKDPAAVPETAKAANVGGVVGKIYMQNVANIDLVKKQEDNAYVNANVANSYNTGDVQGYTGVGGVVGDTTEQTDASAVLYDVYNAGQIGDDTYTYFARHVGGVAGRLSGYIEKAYNTGDIYNYDTTVGGIAGWWYNGTISNVFNTGNITVRTNTEMQVGGIVGSSSPSAQSLSYAYNLGTIRGFQEGHKDNGEWADIYAGGIIGRARGSGVSIDNVYTLGNLYAATGEYDATTGGSYTRVGADNGLGAIYGGIDNPKELTNANYITPENPTDVTKPKFEDLSEQAKAQGINVVEYNDKSNAGAYKLNATGVTDNIKKLNTESDWSVNNGAWRLYENGTPILNVFTPNMATTDAWKRQLQNTGATVQYGTAYNPMLTIVNLEKANGIEDVKFNWDDLGLYGAGGLAVYGGDLTITGFESAGDGRYFGGTIFSEHALAMNGTGTNFNLGSASKLYGSSVTLTNGGDISAYGEITSMNGDIEITGKNVEIIGSLTAKEKGEKTEIDGISGASRGTMDTTNLNDPDTPMKSVSDMFTYTTKEGSVADGDITVTASGAAEVLYGNLGTGSVSTAGNFTVNGGTTDGGSVYVDSDLSGTTGNINLSAGGEVLLDITNIAKANSKGEGDNGKDALHTFLGNYDKSKGNHKEITLSSENDDEIIAIDMWNDGKFDLDKYNDGDKAFGDAIQALGKDLAGKTHIWISDAEQLKGIQSYAETNGGSGILSYNFALKGNIDASALTGYEEIGGSDKAYSGTFDGRGFRIIGLNAAEENKESASSGIFSRLTGTVKDLRVYASKFFDNGESAGAIASVNEGTITGVTTFGNSVTAEDGAAGGIAGENRGSILESTASDSVTASGANAYAGGVAGVNTGSIGAEGEEGESAQITADSAVRSGTDGAAAIGGVVGKNETDGKVWLANSLGVTTGAKSEATGGIAGTNSGTMTSLYNESIVTGGSSVGGVAGDNSGTMKNAVNATGVTGTVTNTGGLIGNNSGTVDSGRNAGTINGTNNVGGMVGANKKGGMLENLSNAVTAAIFGSANVGGIAGTNSGTITSDNNLVNEGTVYGNQYVGGIAGVNEQGGVIQNVTSETLVLKTSGGDDAKYFGGIAGQNAGTITDATNESNVRAEGAEFVGGIAGKNTETGWLTGSLVNNGDVTGRSNVGGLAGVNNNSSLLKGGADNPLRVTNNGTITATNGGAGGIFHTNTGDIEYAVLTNNGTIIATGENANTGGLFGENSGNASFSSLVNTGKVSGGANTGGLIGYNTGTLTGGRGTGANGMTLYKYQIYNNGAVSGGDNTGGLIGTNDTNGMLYAAYNTGTVTGAVYKDDGTVDHYTNNIGGIVGKNAGTVSSVFNTIMTADGQNQFVTGASNAGGLVGFNAGTLTDGYNTTGVSGGGNAVGTNTGTIRNVYATNTTGRLIDINKCTASNVYTFAADDGSARFVSEAERMFSRFYGGFGFGSMWKNYDGWSTPMLKVFLTQAGYSADTELVQTGYPMSLPIKDYVVAGDNLIAYDNANALLVALANTELGEDYLAFYSTQIAASGEGALFNPNNLGYDIDVRYSIVPLFEHNTGYLHWLHRGGDRERNFRERKAEIYFHEGGMVHEEAL